MHEQPRRFFREISPETRARNSRSAIERTRQRLGARVTFVLPPRRHVLTVADHLVPMRIA